MAADGSNTPALAPELHEHPTVAAARLRKTCEAAVEKLLQILDELGGDPDLEPSLGAAERATFHKWTFDQRQWADGNTDDREDARDDEEPNLGWESPGAQMRLDAGAHDWEPALGWPEHLDQTRDRRGRTEHEDEPSIGSSDHRDQRLWAQGYDRDDSEREDVSEGEGDPGADDCEPEEADIGVEYADEGMDQRFVISGQFGDQTLYTPVGERGA